MFVKSSQLMWTTRARHLKSGTTFAFDHEIIRAEMHLKAYKIVMRSIKMSLNSNIMKIQFSSAMCASHLVLCFGETPIRIDLTVPGI